MKKEKLYLSTIDDSAQHLARKYGLGLEIAEFSTAWNLDREFSQTDALVKEKMQGIRRFTMHGPYSELFPSAVDPLVRQVAAYRFSQTLKLAQTYGIHKVVFHGGFYEKLYFPCWFQEQSRIFWQEFAEKIPEDMTVCLENVMETEPELLGEVLRQVNCKKLKMCLDAGHAQAYSKASPMQWIAEYGDLIDHFHIHNNDGTRDSHSPLTEGVIPMEQLFDTIEKQCPQATITLELMEGASSVEWLLEKDILEE